MITLLNKDSNNWDKYNVLFRDAWKTLVQPDPTRPDHTLLKPIDKAAADNGKTAFSNLAHYFAYINDLISIDPLYVMLPIDEAPFEINANTREIKVPENFQKCSGVQSDNYAEIVTFTIDRYFDYKDLDQASIAVQWINDAAQTEGVSFIQLKDLKTYGDENKIRFGWPLTSEMTAAAGNLRFAVRFFTAQRDAENNIVEFNYLLNTTPASIPIKNTLQVKWDGEDTIIKDNDLGLFTSYITNSMNPSYGIPTEVEFILVEDEFPQEGHIPLSTDTLTLKAQAITKDLNTIIYEWYRIKDGVETKIVNNDDYKVEFTPELFNPTLWPTNRPTMTLWVENTDDSVPAYIPYLGEWPEENPGDLFIMKTSLTFLKDGGDVSGEYYVKGINANEVNSVEENSRKCHIKSPAEVKIVEGEDLNEHMFLDKDSYTLTIKLVDDKADPQQFYNVYYSATPFTVDQLKEKPADYLQNDSLIEVTTGNTVSHTLDVNSDPKPFGYYVIQPISKLNRVTQDETYSQVCYVSDHPLQPTGTLWVNNVEMIMEDVNEDTVLDNVTIDPEATGKWLDTEGKMLGIDTKMAYKVFTLKVKRTTTDDTAYNIGEVSYKWFMSYNDGPAIEILTPSDTTEGPIAAVNDDGSISIRAINPESESGKYVYQCHITNTIADESAQSDNYFFVVM